MPGSRLGVVAPSGAIDCMRDFKTGLANLTKMGFDTVVSDGAFDRWMHMAGSDRSRAESVNRMFADPSIDGIICARGGAGASRILDLLDYDMIRRKSKPFIGFSDITALHLALWTKCKLVCYSGAMVAKGWHKPRRHTRETFRALLVEADRPRWAFRPSEFNIVSSGIAEGRLIGGNLAVLCGLLGTPYFKIDYGSMLFLEDVDEGPGRIDRMLTQLRLAGIFKSVHGVLFGRFTGQGAQRSSRDRIQDVINDHFRRGDIPVVSNLPFGHIPDMLTIPIGVRARLDTRSKSIEFLEKAVR
jgi:muramoyltetrapeptide carboxypeptidase